MKKFSFFLIPFLVVFLSVLTMAQTNFWQKINGPFGDTVNSLGINASDIIFLESNNGLFSSSDNGITWEHKSSLNFLINFAFSPAGEIFADGVGVYRSADNGVNWIKIYDQLIQSIAINDSGYIFIGYGYETGGDVKRSTDNGASWFSTGLAVNSYALAINSSGTIFSGGWYQNQNSGGVFRSTDFGASWMNTDLPTSNYNTVTKLAISPTGHIFAVTYPSDGVFRSTDEGEHWTSIKTNFWPAALVFNSIGHIFAGAISGVYRTIDDGANWTNISTGLTNNNVTSIAINTSGTIFAATTGGLFRSVQSTTSVKNFSPIAPISFSLNQNYPNPFNPSTAIKYAVPFESNVNIRFYNSLGQIVREVNEGTRQPGNYEINFNSSGLASGIYFYSIKAVSTNGKNDFSAVKKMILLK